MHDADLDTTFRMEDLYNEVALLIPYLWMGAYSVGSAPRELADVHEPLVPEMGDWFWEDMYMEDVARYIAGVWA